MFVPWNPPPTLALAGLRASAELHVTAQGSMADRDPFVASRHRARSCEMRTPRGGVEWSAGRQRPQEDESVAWWTARPNRPLVEDRTFAYSKMSPRMVGPANLPHSDPICQAQGPKEGSRFTLHAEGPDARELIHMARHSPAFAEELSKLKRRQANAQNRLPPPQQLASDGQPIVTRLLGGGPPSPVASPCN